MKILVFDNYDSFTYNLVQMIEQIVGEKVDVFRNDQISLEDIEKYDKIILSPGPGIPEEAGILLDLIKKYAPEKSISAFVLVSKRLRKHLAEVWLIFPKFFMALQLNPSKLRNIKFSKICPKLWKSDVIILGR